MIPLVLCATSTALFCGSPLPYQASEVPAGGEARPALQYDVTLEVDPESRTVMGHARLAGASGPFRLRFSDNYAFKTLEPRLTGDLSISSAGEELEGERVDGFVWQVEPSGEDPDDAAIEFEWTIRIDHREHPEVIAATDAYEQPYLTGEHGMLFTAAVVPIPEFDVEGGMSVDVQVTVGAPEAWDVTAPWPSVDGEGRCFTPTLDGLRNDVVLVGDWSVRDVQAGTLAATFAFAPGEEWLEPMVEERLGRIIEAEIELFGGAPQPKFLFVFGPSDGVTGYGGSPKSNSMTLFVNEDLPEDFRLAGLSHLVAHEFHHTWMRARCRPEPELRFVIEGFTDYFAYLVTWRLGFLSNDAFLGALEEKIGIGVRALDKYGRSLADAGGPEFFLGRAAYDACYRSGLTLALWTDLALRRMEEPRTLDEFMRGFYGSETWDDGTRPTLAHWEAHLQEWLGDPFTEQQIEAVRSMDGLDLQELFAAAGTPVTTKTHSAGSSPRANFSGATLRVLDPLGPAALAGLRARDLLKSVNGIAVTDASEVRQAWSRSVDGNLVLVFERDGEESTIDVPVPTLVDYELPPSILETLVE